MFTLDSVNLLAIVNRMPVNGMSTYPGPFSGLDTDVCVTDLGVTNSPGKGTIKDGVYNTHNTH